VQVVIVLHSVLRDKLPREAQGRGTLSLPVGATVADALTQVGVNDGLPCAVNGQIEPNRHRALADGDRVEVFVRLGGG